MIHPPDPDQRVMYERMHGLLAETLDEAFEFYARLSPDGEWAPILEKVMVSCVVELAHIETLLAL